VEAQELAGGELLVDERPIGDETERRLRLLPFTVTLPEVGFSNPAIIRSVVVLPAPFGPRKPWISPGCTSRVTPSTAVN